MKKTHGIIIILVVLIFGVFLYDKYSIKSPYDTDYETMYNYELKKFFGDHYSLSKYRDIGSHTVSGDPINCWGWDIEYKDENNELQTFHMLSRNYFYADVLETYGEKIKNHISNLCLINVYKVYVKVDHHMINSTPNEFSAYKLDNDEVDACFGEHFQFNNKISNQLFMDSKIYLIMEMENIEDTHAILQIFPNINAILNDDKGKTRYFQNGKECYPKSDDEYIKYIKR